MKDRHARQVNLGEESNHEALNTIRHNENKNLVLAHDVEEIGDEPQNNTSLSGRNEARKEHSGRKEKRKKFCFELTYYIIIVFR